MSNYKLISKKQLTNDVFELIFEWEDKEVKPGQFMMFNLVSWLKRAYSISHKNWNKFEFVIKRLENGKWWSKEICDSNVWDSIDFSWPFGHFVLQENNSNKIFIWTGTWFAPLYFQFIEDLKKWNKNKILFLFWVRTKNDFFYQEELENIKKNYPNFDYKIFLSKEDMDWFEKWHVTTYINKENISGYEEFYMCWSNPMIQESRELLEKSWVQKEKIYFEQY